LLEACEARDRRRSGDKGGRERREDLALGLAEVAAEDCGDRDKGGDRNECRRAEEEDATKRHL